MGAAGREEGAFIDVSLILTETRHPEVRAPISGLAEIGILMHKSAKADLCASLEG
jgi:hypothetical protein